MIEKETLWKRLQKVIDPETSLDVVTMGLITDLQVENGGRVKVTFRPSSPVCPLAFKLAGDIRKALKETPGVEKVEMEVVDFYRAEALKKFLSDLDRWEKG